jgi:adenosylcobinamide kinase/adenosylcobinamide-phosphate guanylyltransferase
MKKKSNTRDVTLVLGGARSGKSRRAEHHAVESGLPVVYVATYARQADAEMNARIERHRQDRPAEWLTVEGEYDLAALGEKYKNHCLLMDCLTLWLYYQVGQGCAESQVLELMSRGLEAGARGAKWIIVSNELGLGVVPMGAETREFRDLAGRANQWAAQFATTVEFMLAGLPLKLK